MGYAPAGVRGAFATLLRLDARFAEIIRSTREPLVGQMRLTWWHDALERLDTNPAPAEPLLGLLQAEVLYHGIAGTDLATLVEGWEPLLDPLDAQAVADHAERRGARLFSLAGRLMPGDPATLAAAGRAWAAADLAAHLTQPAIGALASDVAHDASRQAFSKRWGRSSRPLGALALLQLLRMQAIAPFAAYMRLARFRMMGR